MKLVDEEFTQLSDLTLLQNNVPRNFMFSDNWVIYRFIVVEMFWTEYKSYIEANTDTRY